MKRSDLSSTVRALLQRYPEPYDSHYGVRPAPPPDYAPSVERVLDQHRKAMAALVRLETIAAEMHDPWLVSRILLRREALSSSSIEGTHSTLDELLAVEEDDYGGSDERRQAANQVRSYARGLEEFLPQAKDLGKTVFTMDLVQDLHRAVMRADPDYRDAPGELRDRVVWIGGRGHIAYSVYNPPPPAEVEACLRENVAYMRGDGYEDLQSTILVRMAIAHAHFESVHPFRDGNGRVGRLLLPMMMAAEGHVPVYLSPYIEAHKGAYIEALKAAQQKLDWATMAGFVADAILGTADELLATRRALAILGDQWRTRRRFRSGSAALRALALLPDYPVVTVNRLAALLSVSFAPAAEAVKALCEVGILKERTGYARNRLFAATEVLELVNRPFGENPVIGDEFAL
jgi:Fic family protein